MHQRFDRDYPYSDDASDPWSDPGRGAPYEDPEAYEISGDGQPAPPDGAPPPVPGFVPTWYPYEPEDPSTYTRAYPFSVEGEPRPHAGTPSDPAPPAGPARPPLRPPRPEPAADPWASAAPHAPDDRPVARAPLPAPLPGDAWPEPRPGGPRPSPAMPAWQPLSQAMPAPYAVAPPPSSRKPLYPQPNPTEPKKALQDALEIMRRGRWLFLLVLLLTVGGIAYLNHTLPSEYEAAALLLLDTSSEEPGANLPPSEAGGPVFQSRKLSNQALILGQSLTLAERTADRLLETRQVPGSGEPLTLIYEDGQLLPKADLAKRLQDYYVEVEPANEDQDADGIWVRAVSPLAGEAALVANLFAEEYVTLARETGRQHVIASRTFLEEQIERRQAELLALEEQIEAYQSREGAMSLDDEAQRSIAQIASLEASLDDAEIEVSMREAALRSLEEELQQLHPRLTQRVASGVELEITLTQQQIAQLEERVAQIYQRNPELRHDPNGHADLTQLTTQIAELQARSHRLSEQYVDEVFAAGGIDPRSSEGGFSRLSELKQRLAEERVAYSGAQARVTALRERLRDYSRRLVSIPAHSMQLAQLERARQSTEQLYLSLLQKLQEARIAEESRIGFAQVIRPASPPEDPARPNKPLNLALGTILGLLLGIGAAVGRHKLDTRLYTPNDVREHGYNLLGVIPDMRGPIRKAFQRQRHVRVEWRDVSTNLLSLLSPRSPIAEAYRRFHNTLQHTEAGAGRVQTVLVTSPEMGAGKSVTALNLAITASQAGLRTLVVDADLHRPALHTYLGYMPSPDLSLTLLEQRALVRIDQFASGIPNLYALTLRDHTAIPAELLGSPGVRDLIARLRNAFDLIVFDTPPALVATDAALLATQCDATIVVVASGQTKAEDVKETLDELDKVGARVAGMVLNRFDPSQVYGYKSTYKDRYRYYDRSRMSNEQ